MSMKSGHPSTSLPAMEGCGAGGIWTFDAVEARLIEALIVARRVPDREAGWLRIKAAWPDVLRATWLGDYGGEGIDGVSEASVRRVPLSGEQIDAAEEAEGWLGRYLVREADRALLVLALSWKAAGRRVGWTRIGGLLGLRIGRAAIARRYVVAVATIVSGLNGKGVADVRALVRRQLLREAGEAVGSGAVSAVRGRARRRRIEVEILYS